MSHDPFVPKPPRTTLKRAANGDAPPDELAERRRLLLVEDDPARTAPPRPTDRPSLAPPMARTNEPLSMPPDLPPMEAFDLGPDESTEAQLETDDPWVFLRDPEQGLLGAFNASRVSAMVAAGEVADGTEVSFDRRQWSPATAIDDLVNVTDEGETLVIPPILADEAVASMAKPPSAPPKVVGAASGAAVPVDAPLGESTAAFDPDDGDAADGADDLEPPGDRSSRWLVALLLGIAAGVGVWVLSQRPDVEPVGAAAAPVSAPSAAVAVAPDPAPAAASAAGSVAAQIDGPEPAEPPPAAHTASVAADDDPPSNAQQAATAPTPVDPPETEATPAPAEVAEAPVAPAAPRRARRGLITVETGRPLQVRLDGRDTGRTTPTRIRATAGRHTVELVDADGSAVLRRVVRVRAGRTAAVDVRDQLARLDAARQETARLNAAAAPEPAPTAPTAEAPAAVDGDGPTAAADTPAVVDGDGPTAAAAPSEPIEAPAGVEAVPIESPTAAPAPVAAAPVVEKAGGYISVSSSRPLRLYIDGKPTGKQTPVWMHPVDSGDRLVELFDEGGTRVAGRRTTVPERQTVPVLFKL